MNKTLSDPLNCVEMRDSRWLGYIDIPGGGNGVLFSNARVIDIRRNLLLGEEESAACIQVATRVSERAAAIVGTFQGGDLDALEATVDEDPNELEVPDFIPSVPILTADAIERDAARQARRKGPVLEEGIE